MSGQNRGKKLRRFLRKLRKYLTKLIFQIKYMFIFYSHLLLNHIKTKMFASSFAFGVGVNAFCSVAFCENLGATSLVRGIG